MVKASAPAPETAAPDRLRSGVAEWLGTQDVHDGDYDLKIKFRVQDGRAVAWAAPELVPRDR